MFFQSCGNKQITEYYTFGDEGINQQYEVDRLFGYLNGVATTYTIEGNLLSKYHYRRGKAHGRAEMYCESGAQLFSKAHFVNDQIDGIYEEYFCENGQLRAKVLYDLGKLVEVSEIFDRKGDSLFSGDHSDGNGTVLKYDEYGNLSNRFTIKNGLVDGYFVSITNTGYKDSTLYVNGYNEEQDYHFSLY